MVGKNETAARCGKIMFLIGHAFGEAMTDLLKKPADVAGQ